MTLTASTAMMPKRPIMAAREFQTSAFSVNPQNRIGSLGSSFGGSTCKAIQASSDHHQLTIFSCRNWNLCSSYRNWTLCFSYRNWTLCFSCRNWTWCFLVETELCVFLVETELCVFVVESELCIFFVENELCVFLVESELEFFLNKLVSFFHMFLKP